MLKGCPMLGLCKFNILKTLALYRQYVTFFGCDQ